GPGVRQPAWVRNRHNAAAGAPEFSAPSGPAACGSMVGRAVREPGKDLLVGPGGAVSSAPGGRLFSAAGPRLFASDASAVSGATPASGPVLVGSKRFAPSPWGPRPSMKADISTLHKPDILILQRQACFPACSFPQHSLTIKSSGAEPLFFRHFLFPDRNILNPNLVFISERTHTLVCP